MKFVSWFNLNFQWDCTMNEWITIKQFYYHHETFLYESKLRSEGIECFMKDEATVTVDPFLSNAIGGIKLQVLPADVEKAKAIIDAIDKNKSEAHSEFQAGLTVKSREYQKILAECPSCDSGEVFMGKRSLWQEIFGLFSKDDYYCNSCQHEWKEG